MNDGGPAFPQTYNEKLKSGWPAGYGYDGMSLRDWFAGQAIAGAVFQLSIHKDTAAKLAYQYADAMLSARESA